MKMPIASTSQIRSALRGEVDLARILIVGESNPYGGDPRFALWPDPPNCSGWRLCHKILGMEPEKYLGEFDRANLIFGSAWSVPKARDEAARLLVSGRKRFLLLGQKVMAAFGAKNTEENVFGLSRLGWGAHVVCLPHPSGRCLVWNAPGSFDRARKAVDALRAAT